MNTFNTLDVLIRVLASKGADDDASEDLLYRYLAQALRDGARYALPRTIMINGQSNAACVPPNQIGYSALVPLLGADLLGFNHTTQKFSQLVDGSANARANFGGFGTGPGPGAGQFGTRIMRSLATLIGGQIRSYAGAFTGQAIAYFRKSSATKAFFEDASQHPTLNNYNWLKSMVAAAGIVPEWYIWCQGEANGGFTPDEYYAEFNAHCADLFADYPGIKILIIGSIGDENDRNGDFISGTMAGPRLAQRRFVAENQERALFIDTTDMRGQTAFYESPHYSVGDGSYAGWEEVAERCMATWRGLAPRPAVAQIDHLKSALGTGVSWDHIWCYGRSIDVSSGIERVGVWSDGVGTDSLVPGGASGGTHNKSDANFGGRSTITFNHANSEYYTEASIPGSNLWSVFVVARPLKAPLAGNTRALWQVEPAAGGSRIGFEYYAASFAGAPDIFVEGSGSIQFPNVSPVEGDIPHTWMVTYNGTAGTAFLYIDGAFASSVSSLANVTTGATARIRVGSFSGAEFFSGQMACVAAKAGVVADATAAAKAHAWAEVEFKLPT